MTTKQRRYTLKTKEAKQVLTEASEKLHLDLEGVFSGKADVEVVESDIGQIFLLEGKPVMVRIGEKLVPTLQFAQFTAAAPKIVVDMGAVPYVCKGADVMAPGIVRVEGEFSTGDLVVVSDLKFAKSLAVGEALMNATTAKATKKGPVVKTLHFVSDKIWDYIKTLNT